jgi:hypothetical protein
MACPTRKRSHFACWLMYTSPHHQRTSTHNTHTAKPKVVHGSQQRANKTKPTASNQQRLPRTPSLPVSPIACKSIANCSPMRIKGSNYV